jgi:hypothetical protein
MKQLAVSVGVVGRDRAAIIFGLRKTLHVLENGYEKNFDGITNTDVGKEFEVQYGFTMLDIDDTEDNTKDDKQ